MIDYITINKRFRNAVQQCKSYPGADCGSDHNPVICSIRIKLKTIKKKMYPHRLNYATLSNNDAINARYNVEVRNRFELLAVDTSKSNYEIFKEAITQTAKEIIPVKERKIAQKWMTDEILSLMNERRKVKGRNPDEYQRLHKSIRRKCLEAKESWLNEKCVTIEKLRERNMNTMYENIREITGKRICSASGCIRSKVGEVIMEKEKIMDRWAEYVTDLFHDTRCERPSIRKEVGGPKILKAEVRAALNKLKCNKSPGPDEIVVEQIKCLDEFGFDKVTDILNEIYDSGEIPDELTKSIFIALPKKPGTIECELHRTISLMSHLTKLLLRILMMRARSKIKPEISKMQCGFVEDCSTRNAVFLLRNIGEIAI
jgi:hypothetical protein